MDNDKIFEERKKDGGGDGDGAAAPLGACGAGPKAPEKGGVAGEGSSSLMRKVTFLNEHFIDE